MGNNMAIDGKYKERGVAKSRSRVLLKRIKNMKNIAITNTLADSFCNDSSDCNKYALAKIQIFRLF